MIQLAERVKAVSPSMTLAISSRAKAMRQAGLDVCDFAVGEPDFDTPEFIRRAAKAALDDGKTKYGPAAGLPRLRELIAEKLNRENNLPYEPEQVMVSTGGKQALFNVLLAILDEGDEALIPMPYWVSYPEMVKMARARPVYLPTSEETGFKVTPGQLEAAINDRTRALILNYPANPTGTVYAPQELSRLAEVAAAHGIAIVSDEIYEKLIFDGAEHLSIGSLGEHVFDLTVTCNGFSKAYAATGWRLGYAAGPEKVIQAAVSIQSHSTSGANTFAQYGAIAALEGPQSEVERMRLEFEARRSLMVEGVNSVPGLSCAMPGGAFYVFPSISETGLDSMSFCQRLLEQEKVAAVPGIAFGAEGYVRLSYATGRETIAKGIERLRRFVGSVGP